jgi:hypothetical protein
MLPQRLVCSQEAVSRHNLQPLECVADAGRQPVVVQRLGQGLIDVQRSGHAAALDEVPEGIHVQQVLGQHVASQSAAMATFPSRTRNSNGT